MSIKIMLVNQTNRLQPMIPVLAGPVICVPTTLIIGGTFICPFLVE